MCLFKISAVAVLSARRRSRLPASCSFTLPTATCATEGSMTRFRFFFFFQKPTVAARLILPRCSSSAGGVYRVTPLSGPSPFLFFPPEQEKDDGVSLQPRPQVSLVFSPKTKAPFVAAPAAFLRRSPFMCARALFTTPPHFSRASFIKAARRSLHSCPLKTLPPSISYAPTSAALPLDCCTDQRPEMNSSKGIFRPENVEKISG